MAIFKHFLHNWTNFQLVLLSLVIYFTWFVMKFASICIVYAVTVSTLVNTLHYDELPLIVFHFSVFSAPFNAQKMKTNRAVASSNDYSAWNHPDLVSIICSSTAQLCFFFFPHISSDLCLGLLTKPRYSNPFPSPRSARYDELTPEEREERVNRGFARIMQFMTFLGHVDNYLTDKASGLIKVMGRAIETGEDDDEPADNYNRISRHSPTRISTTITT